MRKLLFVMFVAMFFIAAPAMADGPYVAFKYGSAEVDADDLSFTDGIDTLTVELDGSDKVNAPGISVGYDSGDSRFEIEYFTRGTAKFDGTAYWNGTLMGATDEFELDSDTFFANIYWDFEVARWLELYLGFGVGLAKHSTDIGLLSESSSDLALNYQVGAAFIVTNNLAVDLGARYSDLGDAEIGDMGLGLADDISVKSKEIIVALRYTF